MPPVKISDSIVIEPGDCLDVLPTMDPESVDAIITDPPYGLSFMGKDWDHGIPGPAFWQAALRVAKPGAHLLAFGGTRTHHRLMCAIEDAGWEIRDCIMWVYASGFPKSLDVGKAIDKAAGAEREVMGPSPHSANRKPKIDGVYHDMNVEAQRTVTAPATPDAAKWNGWGTALKPAYEPIVLARKPIQGTVAANVLQHGTGAINVDGGRIGTSSTPRKDPRNGKLRKAHMEISPWMKRRIETGEPLKKDFDGTQGRWPANFIHDGSDEVLEGFPTDAARYFYCAKTSVSERDDADHPTIKPVALMRYLVRLITPPGGLVLDPFMGSGSTAIAAYEEGTRFHGVEMDPDNFNEARRRINDATRQMLFAF